VTGLDEGQTRVLAAVLAMQRQSWERGVASHALLDLGQDALVEAMARDMVTRQTADGQLADMGGDAGIVNCGAAGEAVWWAAQRSGDARLAAAFDRQLRRLLEDAPRAEDGPSSTSPEPGNAGSTPSTWWSQMIAYGALSGVADGWLPRTYEAVAGRCWTPGGRWTRMAS
jgi:hypothetical protein